MKLASVKLKALIAASRPNYFTNFGHKSKFSILFSGFSALMLAVAFKHDDRLEIVKRLLARGAKVNLQCSERKVTALHVAAQKGSFLSFASLRTGFRRARLRDSAFEVRSGSELAGQRRTNAGRGGLLCLDRRAESCKTGNTGTVLQSAKKRARRLEQNKKDESKRHTRVQEKGWIFI